MSKETNCQKCYHYEVCKNADDFMGDEGCEKYTPVADVEDGLKTTEIKRQNKWIAHLKEMLAKEREKIAGYEQMAKIYTAYIYLLLKKLEAVEDNKVTFKEDEIQEAIRKGETRAIRSEEGWSLYYEE